MNYQVEAQHAKMVKALCKPGEQILAEQTPAKASLAHHAHGIAGEAGELVDALKKNIIYNQPLNKENVVEELGDLEFYMQGLRSELNITREQTLNHNLTKLALRYKNYKYTEQTSPSKKGQSVTRETLQIDQIQIIDRQRQDYGNIQELATSISRYGLIQPIVINQEKRLVAGGRRLAAIKSLGWLHAPITYRETLSVDKLHELELEENVRRKSMSWQEEAFAIAKIHGIKTQRNALEGKSWGQRETSELFGMQVGTVNYCLRVARLLKEELLLPPDQRRAWKCDSINEAWRNVILLDEKNRLEAELAKRAQEEVNKKKQETQEKVDEFVKELTLVPTADDHIIDLRNKAKENYLSLSPQEAKDLYLYNPLNPPDQFQAYYEHKRSVLTEHFSVKLTDMLLLGDSIAYMNQPSNLARFDHIVTDIPYGIDMDNLDQTNTGTDMSSVREEHEVEYNLQLIREFFPAAFRCTKERAFVITWADAFLFRFMHDLAVEAGFAVQRWPFHWCKTQANNQSRQYNFTKATEIAIVCRKPQATLAKTEGMLNYVVASRQDDITTIVEHPFCKPLACWQPLIEGVSIEGQHVFEPFAGRGSGVLSLLKLKRQVTAMEMNETHYNALLLNIQKHYLALNPNFLFK